jgi:hypothetical protein
MRTFVRCAAALAVLCATSLLPGQNCPWVRARTVPEQQTIGPLLPCGGGITVTMPPFSVTAPAAGCPVFILLTPQHDIPEQSPTRTYILNYATVPMLLFRFQCDTSWFLFIPLGSDCINTEVQTIAKLSRSATLNCDDRVEIGL